MIGSELARDRSFSGLAALDSDKNLLRVNKLSVYPRIIRIGHSDSQFEIQPSNQY